MADIFDEIAEDLRADRAKALARRYGGVVVVLVLLLIAGIGGWKYWQGQQARQAQGVAEQFLAAMRQQDSATASTAGAAGQVTPALQSATDTYLRLAENAPEGYRTLARMRAAGLKVQAGDKAAALALWDRVANDAAADKQLRNLASLLWVQHQLDGGDQAALESRLQPLMAADSPWRALAQESAAWLALRAGQADKAKDVLRKLVNDTTAPEGVRGRASGLLAQLGEPSSPVQIGPQMPSPAQGGTGG